MPPCYTLRTPMPLFEVVWDCGEDDLVSGLTTEHADRGAEVGH